MKCPGQRELCSCSLVERIFLLFLQNWPLVFRSLILIVCLLLCTVFFLLPFSIKQLLQSHFHLIFSVHLVFADALISYSLLYPCVFLSLCFCHFPQLFYLSCLLLSSCCASTIFPHLPVVAVITVSGCKPPGPHVALIALLFPVGLWFPSVLTAALPVS